MVKQQRHQGDGADAGDERRLVPRPSLEPQQDQARRHAAEEGDAQVDEHAFRDLRDRYRHDAAFQSEPGRKHRDEDVGVHAVEEDLEQAVEGHEAGGVLRVALRQFVPHDDHGDAPGQADEDQAGHVFGMGREEERGESEHEDGTDDPVQEEGRAEDPYVAEHVPQFLVLHLGQWRIHHQDEPDGDGQVGRAHLAELDQGGHLRRPNAERYAKAHGQEDPQGKVTVSRRQFARRCIHGFLSRGITDECFERSPVQRVNGWHHASAAFPVPATLANSHTISRQISRHLSS